MLNRPSLAMPASNAPRFSGQKKNTSILIFVNMQWKSQGIEQVIQFKQ